MRLRIVRALLWKELLDLSRDRRTLLSVIVIPLVFLPAMGLVVAYMFSTQPPVIVVLDHDHGEPVRMLVDAISSIGSSRGGVELLVVNDSSEIPRDVDLVVEIPEGFSENVSSLDGTGYYILNKTVGTSKGDLAVTIVTQAFSYLREAFVRARVEALARRANMTVSVEGLLRPVDLLRMGFRTQAGGKATVEQEHLYYTMMVLTIALFMSVSTPISFVADSVAGERERKTLECLLVAPASRGEVLLSKLLACVVLSLVASGANTLGAYSMYFLVLSGVAGGGFSLPITPDLVGVFGVTVFLTVMTTVSIALLASCLADSVRAAHSNSVAVSLASSFVMFASLYGDVEKLDPVVKALVYMIPYTHCVLTLDKYLEAGIPGMIPHVAVLACFIAVMTYISYRVFKSERIFYGRRVKGRS